MMKILLLGDYSNVHATLAKGLRTLGHEVTVASDGDGWKNYQRDVDLRRGPLGAAATFSYLLKLFKEFPHFRGYDVVQIINPVFLSLQAARIYPFYKYLRRHNGRIFMGAFGMDHYWVKTCLDCKTFRYSDFNLGKEERISEDNEIWKRDWLVGPKGRLNKMVAADCDGIVAGLYEYYACYKPEYAQKLRFIPFPIDVEGAETVRRTPEDVSRSVRFFVGIQRKRHAYKGTDIMLRALERVHQRYPNECEIVQVENVPFDKYKQLMLSCDVILDQLYSYTPAMNALQAMAQGLVVVGGGEPENYEILADTDLFPIVNVLPDEEDVYCKLCRLVEERHLLPQLSRQSRQYISRYHEQVKVARQYVDFWQS